MSEYHYTVLFLLLAVATAFCVPFITGVYAFFFFAMSALCFFMGGFACAEKR